MNERSTAASQDGDVTEGFQRAQAEAAADALSRLPRKNLEGPPRDPADHFLARLQNLQAVPQALPKEVELHMARPEVGGQHLLDCDAAALSSAVGAAALLSSVDARDLLQTGCVEDCLTDAGHALQRLEALDGSEADRARGRVGGGAVQLRGQILEGHLAGREKMDCVGEPEPLPSKDVVAGSVASQQQQLDALLRKSTALCLEAHYQQLQLATEIASLDCYFSCCAPFFFRLSERSRLQAGTLMDLTLAQGGSVTLPALAAPARGLGVDRSETDRKLFTSLEACLQIEASKNLDVLSAEVFDFKNVRLRKTLEALAAEGCEQQEQLARLASSVLHGTSKHEELAMFESGLRGRL